MPYLTCPLLELAVEVAPLPVLKAFETNGPRLELNSIPIVPSARPVSYHLLHVLFRDIYIPQMMLRCPRSSWSIPSPSLPFIPACLLIRAYTTAQSYESILRAAHQRSKSACVALNPPSSTLPPPLSLPDKLPHLPIYKYYFRVGKAYAVFYKNGLQAIWRNYKLARALPNQSFLARQAHIHQAVRDGLLSRADFQLIRRTRHDIKKVPFFALIWILCGEFTPLVVLSFAEAVPRTLWIPKQVQNAREGAEKRRAESRDANVALLSGPSRQHDIESMAEGLQRNVLKSYAQCLGLYPRWWDRWIPTMVTTSLLKKRVYRRFAELEVDDFAIKRDGGIGKMMEEEVQMACEERGLDILGREEESLRGSLEQWMEWRGKT